jgi:natural resistance-associated macrophage protein
VSAGAVVDHREYDATVEIGYEGEAIPDPDSEIKFQFSWRKLWRFAGPGWLMSLAYLDPGNLEGDLQQGAYTNLKLVWVLFWATFMGLILQEMSARLGIVTGNDLAQTVRDGYPRWLNYTIYVQMEIAVIGADIQEVVGTGIAFNLLSSGYIPVWAGCLITSVDALSFLAIQRFGVRYLEAVICLLITVMAVSFFVNWGVSNTDPAALLEGLVVPRLPTYAVTQAVGTIGAVIMPHNLYLHSGLVLSRKINRASPHRVNDAIQYARIESASALLFSFMINLAVVASNANEFFAQPCAEDDNGPFACIDPTALIEGGDAYNASIYPPGYTGEGASCIATRTNRTGVCGEIGLRSEGYALSIALGDSALYIWAIGLFAAGQSATMVCTYAGQIIMGGCLSLQIAPWKRVAFTRIFALGPALLVALSTYSNQRLFNSVNEYLNVLQSVQLPFAMLPVLHFTASRKRMGRFRSGRKWMGLSVSLALLVISINVTLVVQFVEDFSAPAAACVALYGCAYAFVCVSMVWDDFKVRILRVCRGR